MSEKNFSEVPADEYSTYVWDRAAKAPASLPQPNHITLVIDHIENTAHVTVRNSNFSTMSDTEIIQWIAKSLLEQDKVKIGSVGDLKG